MQFYKLFELARCGSSHAVNQVVIVVVMRQSGDIPKILGKAAFMIRKGVAEILNCIEQGNILLSGNKRAL